jgi:dienelactone hydrolase
MRQTYLTPGSHAAEMDNGCCPRTSPRRRRRKQMKLNGWLLAAGLALGVLGASGGAEKLPGAGPWNVKELQKPPQYEIAGTQEVQEGDTAVTLSTIYYAGEPWMGKPTRVFAYYARPAEPREKKLPAMVLVHGGGGAAFPQWARLWAGRGYAALAMDLGGKGPERQALPDGGPDQTDEWKFQRLKDGIKNAWTYHSVAAVIRGASLLRSLKEVDRNRVGITGISWGGYLTTLAMSLDDRLKVAVPVYGCGYLHENSVWVPTLEKLPADERRTWIENFEPSQYLPRCKIPSLWVNGTNDFAYPLDSYQKSYRATRGPRVLCVTVKMPHGHEAGWAPQEIQLFVDSVLKAEELARGLAVIAPPVVKGEKVRVLYDSPTAALKAQIHWTKDLDKPWQQREWESGRAVVQSLDTVEATLPAPRPLVFFLTITDRRGAISSSEHMELR